MCGITGIFDPLQHREIDQGLLVRMNNTQHHRGPDEHGTHFEPGVGLAHRRLSIIDLSSGQQPLYNEDRTVVVTYNGEIYNFPELTKELKAAGHTFRTHSDTEVIVHAWEQWGEDCVKRFRGMFVFGLWDRNRKTLFMARDRLGIKPLYYAQLADGQLLFATELKALLVHPGLERKIDPEAVEEYFAYGYVPDPKTILRNVFKLPPAHTLTHKAGERAPVIREYWDVPFAPIDVGSEQDIGEEMIERLREAVRIRMMAEVPLGAFLSGGIDSSSVVAMMAGLSNDPVKTCSISFGEAKFNESHFADMVAKQYGTDHQVEQSKADDFDLLDMLAGLYDEPYADSSAMPTYRVCELARRKVTVALSGDGGDENLAGYRRHRWHMYEERVRSRLPQVLRGPLFGTLGRVYPKADWAPKVFRAKSTFQALARSTLEAYLHSVSVVPDTLRPRLFSKRFRGDLAGYHAKAVFERHAKSAPADDPLSLIQYLDMKTYLPGDILTKVDRASMAHSLEVRVPLLDHEFVEWVSGISPALKLKGREGKYIFKKALEPHLSDDILYRDKMGFGVPLASWFRGPLRDRVRQRVLSETMADTGVFDMSFLQRLVDEHQRGTGEHSASIWALMMFDAFLSQTMSGGNSTMPERSAA